MTMILIITIAILVEGLTEYINKLFYKVIPTKAIAAVIGVLVCVVSQTDMFELLDITLSVPYLGAVLTGILVSRGSNYLHDVIGKLEN